MHKPEFQSAKYLFSDIIAPNFTWIVFCGTSVNKNGKTMNLNNLTIKSQESIQQAQQLAFNERTQLLKRSIC